MAALEASSDFKTEFGYQLSVYSMTNKTTNGLHGVGWSQVFWVHIDIYLVSQAL